MTYLDYCPACHGSGARDDDRECKCDRRWTLELNMHEVAALAALLSTTNGAMASLLMGMVSVPPEAAIELTGKLDALVGRVNAVLKENPRGM